MSESTYTIALATPTVELEVTASEVSGKTSTLKAGFVRHPRKALLRLSDAIIALQKNDLKEVKKLLKSIDCFAPLAALKEIKEDDLIRCSVVYLSEVEIMAEGGKTRRIDTRKDTAMSLEDLLEALLDHVTFYQALAKAMYASYNVSRAEIGMVGKEQGKN